MIRHGVPNSPLIPARSKTGNWHPLVLLLVHYTKNPEKESLFREILSILVIFTLLNDSRLGIFFRLTFLLPANPPCNQSVHDKGQAFE
jgi:hypothetical protein